MKRHRRLSFLLGAAFCLLMLIPLALSYVTWNRGGTVTVPSPSSASLNSGASPGVAKEQCSSRSWHETPLAGAVVGAVISGAILLLTRRGDRRREHDIRQDERQQSQRVREIELADAMARQKVGHYERQIAERKQVLAERQSTYEAVVALYRLPGLMPGGFPGPDSLLSFQMFPLAFDGEPLRDGLSQLGISIRAYAAIPPSAKLQLRRAFSNIQTTAENLKNQIEVELRYAAEQVADMEKGGRIELNDQLDTLRDIALGS